MTSPEQPASDDAPTVQDDPDGSRYVLLVGDGEAGVARYERLDGATVLTHTVIDPAFEGQGLGSVLVRGALDDIRTRGERVVPQCPFAARWISKHPDYADLVAN